MQITAETGQEEETLLLKLKTTGAENFDLVEKAKERTTSPARLLSAARKWPRRDRDLI